MTSIAEELAEIKQQGLWRKLVETSVLAEHQIQRESKLLWNFASNDYLGLSRHPAIQESFKEGGDLFGHGATASRLICGSSPAHRALENQIAAMKKCERALFFSSGYAVALGTIPALVGKDDFVILDKLSHACLIDAARLSGATLRIFRHNDMGKLRTILEQIRAKSKQARILIVTESVFSMDGDTAPLAEIVALKDEFSGLLFVDEAHGFGVLGEHGAGLTEKLGLQGRIELQMGTLSKAAGLSGGFLAASQEIIDLLINRARSFIYSTAPSPALAWAACRSLAIIASDEGQLLRQKLQKNIALLSGGTGLNTPIIPLMMGTNDKALSAAAALADSGFLVPAIRFPTVPRNSARLRISLSATHSPQVVADLAARLLQLENQ